MDISEKAHLSRAGFQLRLFIMLLLILCVGWRETLTVARMYPHHQLYYPSWNDTFLSCGGIAPVHPGRYVSHERGVACVFLFHVTVYAPLPDKCGNRMRILFTLGAQI